MIPASYSRTDRRRDHQHSSGDLLLISCAPRHPKWGPGSLQRHSLRRGLASLLLPEGRNPACSGTTWQWWRCGHTEVMHRHVLKEGRALTPLLYIRRGLTSFWGLGSTAINTCRGNNKDSCAMAQAASSSSAYNAQTDCTFPSCATRDALCCGRLRRLRSCTLTWRHLEQFHAPSGEQHVNRCWLSIGDHCRLWGSPQRTGPLA